MNDITKPGERKYEKTLVALGDSITVGTYTAPTDKSADSISSPNYVELVAEALGYTELMNSFSSCRFLSHAVNK